MQMRFIQPVADIRNHLADRVLNSIERINEARAEDNTEMIEVYENSLERYGFDKDVTAFEVEHDIKVLEYIYWTKIGFSKKQESHKPSAEDFTRIFQRHLDYLQRREGVTPQSRFPSSDWRKLLEKEAKACKYYIFQFSLPAWYEKLPDVLLTLEQRAELRKTSLESIDSFGN